MNNLTSFKNFFDTKEYNRFLSKLEQVIYYLEMSETCKTYKKNVFKPNGLQRLTATKCQSIEV